MCVCVCVCVCACVCLSVCVCVVSEGDVVDKQTGGAGESQRERHGSQLKYTFLFV